MRPPTDDERQALGMALDDGYGYAGVSGYESIADAHVCIFEDGWPEQPFHPELIALAVVTHPTGQVDLIGHWEGRGWLLESAAHPPRTLFA